MRSYLLDAHSTYSYCAFIHKCHKKLTVCTVVRMKSALDTTMSSCWCLFYAIAALISLSISQAWGVSSSHRRRRHTVSRMAVIFWTRQRTRMLLRTWRAPRISYRLTRRPRLAPSAAVRRWHTRQPWHRLARQRAPRASSLLLQQPRNQAFPRNVSLLKVCIPRFDIIADGQRSCVGQESYGLTSQLGAVLRFARGHSKN